MAAVPVMTFKTFLPMGEKPPDIIGRGNIITTKQAPTVISFPPSQQFPEEFLVLELSTLSSTTFSLIVVILSPVSLSNSFAMVFPMHYTTRHLHRNMTTTNSSSITTNIITTINTIMIITVRPPKTHMIAVMPDSPARLITILSFTSATVTTAATTAAKTTAFTTTLTTAAINLHSSSLFIVAQFTTSNIITRATATAANDNTPIPIQPPTDAFEYNFSTATILTSATDASTISACLLYAIQLAAARVSTAADDDTSNATTCLLLAIHLVTAKDTPAAAGESTPSDFYL
jgi:hypothetical protein